MNESTPIPAGLTAEERYQFLLALDLKTLSGRSAVDVIGERVDTASDRKDHEALRGVIDAAEGLDRKSLSATQLATLRYFVGNAWASLDAQTANRVWEHEHAQKAILNFRLALSDAGARARLPKRRVGQILTNLGNQFSHVGRVVEAIECWDDALELVPDFGMGLANKGHGLATYSRLAPDSGHGRWLLRFARHYMAEGLRIGLETDAQRAFFSTREADASKRLGAERKARSIKLKKFSLGKSQAERRYRKWCLARRLFLHPLNDVGPLSVAARDRMTPPTIVTKLDEGPVVFGFFNQLKQEYVSARFLYFDGVETVQPPYADRDVFQYDTLDHPTYCLAAEKVKASFRIAYSLFDKIGYLLNHYLDLKIPEKRVSFRTLWYDEQDRRKPLRSQVTRRGNWPLSALLWVSRDLSEDRPDFVDAIAPDARLVAEIRNHLEHKYLKLHEGEWVGAEIDVPGLTDTLALSVYRREFEAKALRLLKLARAALVYVVLAIRYEEASRRREEPKTGARLPVRLDVLDDDGKR